MTRHPLLHRPITITYQGTTQISTTLGSVDCLTGDVLYVEHQQFTDPVADYQSEQVYIARGGDDVAHLSSEAAIEFGAAVVHAGLAAKAAAPAGAGEGEHGCAHSWCSIPAGPGPEEHWSLAAPTDATAAGYEQQQRTISAGFVVDDVGEAVYIHLSGPKVDEAANLTVEQATEFMGTLAQVLSFAYSYRGVHHVGHQAEETR